MKRHRRNVLQQQNESNAENSNVAEPLSQRSLTHESRIYFAEAVGLGLVKIGYSTNIEARMKAIKRSELDGVLSDVEVVLLGSIPGDEFGEFVLHRHFAEFRVRGEWFNVDAARPFIEDILKLGDENIASWFEYHRNKERPTAEMKRRILLNRSDYAARRARRARQQGAA